MTLRDKARDWAKANGLDGLQNATLGAKERTGTDVSTQVQQGLFRVVRIEYTKRTSKVIPLSEWGSLERTVQFLDTL